MKPKAREIILIEDPRLRKFYGQVFLFCFGISSSSNLLLMIFYNISPPVIGVQS